eukprot:497500-Lingulodinium_polyedra.AAC.1
MEVQSIAHGNEPKKGLAARGGGLPRQDPFGAQKHRGHVPPLERQIRQEARGRAPRLCTGLG